MSNKMLTFEIGGLLNEPIATSEKFTLEGEAGIDGVKILKTIRAKVEIMRIEDGFNVVVKGFSAEVERECDRCLEKYPQKITFDHAERQFYLDPPKEVEDQNDIFLINKKNQTIDISEMIRQEIILHFPVNSVCFQSCKGICSHCGINRNKAKCECIDDERSEKPLSKLKDLIK